MKTIVRLFCIIAPILLMGCQQGGHGHGHGLIDRVRHSHRPFDPKAAGLEITNIEAAKVLVAVKGHKEFYTLTRKEHIKKFRCSKCHSGSDKSSIKVADNVFTHSDIGLTHGDSDTMSCLTCHDRSDRNKLTSITGEKIDFNHSYKLCAQCHFQQKKDWVGGAHGKRVSFWAGERVVRNCTTCHDPHKPGFSKRWPKTYSPPLQR